MSNSPQALSPGGVAPPTPPNTFFRGPNGIRAGWRVLIFLAIYSGLVFLFGIVVRIVFAGAGVQSVGSTVRPLGLVLLESTLLVTALAALIMARIEHRAFGDYGLPLRNAFGKDFWIGTTVGFLAISACLLTIFLLHGFRLTGLAIHGSVIVSALASWTAAFVIVGLSEEFAFRGYLQYTLTTGIGFWPAAILLSILFGVAHSGNPGESKFGLVSVVCFAVLFCFILRRTGNLWWAVGFHAGWDWGQTFFYGVSDSGLVPYHNLLNSTFNGPRWLTGGSVGPEASVFTPIVLLLVGIAVSRIYRERQYHPAGEKVW